MPDTPDTCGREPYRQRKYRGFKNIRICVDGAWITRNLVASPSSQLLRKCLKIYRNNCPSYFVIYQASIIPAHFERNFLRESRENNLAHSLLRDLVSITYCQLQLQPVEVLQQYIFTHRKESLIMMLLSACFHGGAGSQVGEVGAYIFQRPFLKGLSTDGNLRFKSDWASLVVERKFTVFALSYFVFEGNLRVQAPPPGGQLIFGGAI